MTYLAEVPRTPDWAPQSPFEVELLVDVALGVVGSSIGVVVSLVEGVTRWPPLRSQLVWRPARLPARLQPASLVADLARRGAQHRERATERVDRELDHWTPVLVERVVSRLDLTGLVTRHVDLDAVVSGVDLDTVVAGVDLNAAVAHVDLDAVVGRVDLDAAVSGVDIDAIVQRLDIDAVIDRVDLVAIVEEVIAAIDLPAIIRESTGSMASETVRGARMTGISVDEAITRTLERHRIRRPPAGTAPGPGTEAP